jgi:hypothetical protein
MARVFGASGSDATVFTQGGGFTGLDNLARGNFTYGVVGRRTHNANNLYLGGKNPGASTSAGWEFLSGFNVGGINPGHLRFIVWTSGTRYDVSTGTTGTTNIMTQNQHEMVAATWVNDIGQVKMYRNVIDTPISEVTEYAINTSGSGTTGFDNTGTFTAWNSPRGSLSTPFIGDGSWVFVYDRALSQNELQVVQEGILTFGQAVRRPVR